nr:pyridoxamine 5'-phosphate oxidase family protein [Robertkochia sp. 3YJGBD-33]
MKEATENNDHPFRYFTLGTTGITKTPRLRTVVLREVSDELKFTIYTDKRSRKVTHIKEHNEVCLLFYKHDELLQLKIEGIAYLEEDKEKIARVWKSISEKSRKDYITSKEPGTKIDNPDNVEYLENTNHFTIMYIKAKKLEYLQLKRPNHIRLQFNRESTKDWQSSFMVP